MKRATAMLICLLFASCYAPGTIRRVAFNAEAKGVDRDASTPFTVMTPSGWRVTLTTAQVSIGPIYLRNSSSAGGTLDFSEYGRAVAEVLTTFTVDALDPTSHDVGIPGDGTTEPAVAAEVRLAEAQTGPIADLDGPGSAVAHVVGSALSPDGHTTVSFDGFLRIPLVSPTAGYAWTQAHRVTNVASMLAVDDGGTLTITADATHWLDSVDFTNLPGSGLRDFDSDSARGQVRTGIGARDAFVLSWRAAP